MHKSHSALRVRMSIFKGRRTVSCPAGMTYADTAAKVAAVCGIFEHFHFSRSLHRDRFPLRNNSHSCRVIAPVFKRKKSGKYHVLCVSFSRIADYSAHISSFESFFMSADIFLAAVSSRTGKSVSSPHSAVSLMHGSVPEGRATSLPLFPSRSLTSSR